jgi:hypothetical protein
MNMSALQEPRAAMLRSAQAAAQAIGQDVLIGARRPRRHDSAETDVVRRAMGLIPVTLISLPSSWAVARAGRQRRPRGTILMGEPAKGK